VILYCESSAVLAWLLGEPRSGAISGILNRAAGAITSALTLLEARRGIIRREVLKEMDQAAKEKLLEVLENASADWEVVEVTSRILWRAGQPFPVEPLRTLDAIHLATVVELVDGYPDLKMLSLDDRILKNAEELKIPIAR